MSPAGRVVVLAIVCIVVPCAVGGCGRLTGHEMAPVAVSLEGADPDLAAYLTESLSTARAVPESGELRGRLAMAYEVNGFPDAALETYRQAETLDVEEFSWPYFRALLLAKSGDLVAALESVSRALDIDAEYVPAWLWRGQWLLDIGDYGLAEDAYRRAESLGAGSPATVGLAQIRLRQGRMAEAAALLEPIASEQRHPYVYRLLGEAYRGLDRAEDARISMARGRRAQPLQWFDPRQSRKSDYIAGFKNQMAHAQDLLAAERFEDALEILEPWEAKRPDDAALLTNLGWAHMRLGHMDRAFEILRKGVAKHEEDTAGYYFHYHLGRLHVMRGEVGEALHHLNAASRLNPTQGRPHEERGKLLLRLGRHDEALAALKTALESGTLRRDELLQTMGVVEASRGEWLAATAHFRAAIEVDPSVTITYVFLGRSLAQTGDWDASRDALDMASRLGTHPRDVAAARRVLADLKAESDADADPRPLDR